MKTIKSLSLAVFSILAANFVFTSCNLDELTGGRNGGKISIVVSSDAGVTTKSLAESKIYETIDLSTEDFPFYLSLTQSPYTASPFSEPMTKGTVVTTDNIKDRTSFNINMLLNGSTDYEAIDGTKNNRALYSDGEWTLEHHAEFPDGKDDKLDFWAFSYGNECTYTKGSSFAEFTYTGITPGNNFNDAESMTDFLVANTKGQTEVNNPVNIHFYHALAAVRFNIPASFITELEADQYKQVKVRISGVKKSGTATYTGTAPEYFEWELGEESASVSYTQTIFDINNTDYTSAEYTQNNIKGVYPEASRTLFIIPQELDNVMMTFYIVNNKNKEYVLSTKKLAASEWKPGYIYNYTVGNDVMGTVGVKVTENVFDKVAKENVRVELTSSAASYIRVAIVANWFTSGTSSKVYAPYTGVIEYNTTKWVKSPYDGYYYYKNPILGYTSTEALIGEGENAFKCTSPEPASPFNLHVEMNIIAQAVTYDNRNNDPYYTAGWAWFNLNTKDAEATNSDALAWFKANVDSKIE